ncbi:MAG: M20/M25/M40 family metallo-hydrolase [Candidatus Eisenbacteria bacterium]|nr:M20/M25/M40 family metallo-hydrolase [Candidatus Eisenbacteria bacterium]
MNRIHRPRRAAFLLLAALLFPIAASSFDEERAMAIIGRISSDEFRGRKSGTPDGRRIEEFVAARFEEWGLVPAGGDGTFFHRHPMLVTVEEAASMEILDRSFGVPSVLLPGHDFTVIQNSGSGEVTAEVVFVGHGLSDPAREWDDYADTDVRGKMVLIHRGHPENGYDWERASGRDSTLTEARRRGAAAVLWYQRALPIFGATIPIGVYDPALPLAYVGDRVVDLLLQNTGYDHQRYENELKKGPVPLATGKKIRFSARVRRLPGGEARNVAGLVPGADPILSREIVIIGGHMDHVGANAEGVIYNGADDNASGSATVMELARSFAAAGERPARTLLFVTFAGEEQGLIGSHAFVDDPPVDLDDAVLMINFDMVGQGNGRSGIGGGEYYPEVLAAFRRGLDPEAAESLSIGLAWGGMSSDHGHFRRAGIPVGNVWTEGGHRFYHTPQDDADWIDTIAVGGAGRTAERWIRFVADWPEPLRAEHRAGRSFLYASTQVDWDGRVEGAPPGYVRGLVRWFDGEQASSPVFLDSVGAVTLRAGEADSIDLAAGPAAARSASRHGARALMLGLRSEENAPLSPERAALLGPLGFGLVRWDGAPPDTASASGAAERLETLAGTGACLLVDADPEWPGLLPAGARAIVRVDPNDGERLGEPALYPRGRVLFVLRMEGPSDPERDARLIHRLGRDRVLLDLVPWVATGGEDEITAYLEELARMGPFDHEGMTGLLGGNLERI